MGTVEEALKLKKVLLSLVYGKIVKTRNIILSAIFPASGHHCSSQAASELIRKEGML